MSMLTDRVDLVIGIDTHKQTHSAAFVDRLGAVHEVLEVEANAAGYRRLLDAASEHPGQRVWAVEGTGSYGAGLTAALTLVGEHVVEVERPGRPKRRPWGSRTRSTRCGRHARSWPATIRSSPANAGIVKQYGCYWRRAMVRSLRGPKR